MDYCDASWSTPPGYRSGWPIAWTRPHEQHMCDRGEDHGGDHVCECGDEWSWAASVGMST